MDKAFGQWENPGVVTIQYAIDNEIPSSRPGVRVSAGASGSSRRPSGSVTDRPNHFRGDSEAVVAGIAVIDLMVMTSSERSPTMWTLRAAKRAAFNCGSKAYT